MQAVQEYLDGETSLEDITLQHKISRSDLVSRWARQYHSHGEFKSLKAGNEIYMPKGRATSLDQRQKIANDCLSHGTDYRAAAKLYEASYSQVYHWVKKYQPFGVDGLQGHRGRGKPEVQMTELARSCHRIRELEMQLNQKEMKNDVIKKFIELEKR